jgi:signal transduction histidine kinase/ActR/RegA family two-component response regulator
MQVDATAYERLRRAREWALGWTRWFVTEDIRAQGETATTRALLVVLICPVAVLASLAPGLAQLIDGQPTPVTPLLGTICSVLFLLGPFILRWTKSPYIGGAWVLLVATIVTAYVGWTQHGLDSILSVWLLVIPTFAGFFLGARWTLAFSLLSALCLTGYWLLDVLPGLSYAPSQAQPEGQPFRWINLLTALAAISVLAIFWERAAERARREREELEAQVRRGQKLETVGMLAGGIAHDFNNILAAILGHASLLEGETHDPVTQRRVQAIVDSSRRAAVLVEQMLAYAGRSRTRTGALDLPALVREVVELLRPALDKKTELILDLDRPSPRLAADPVQIQQIAMNLVTNASEALEGKPGRVWVRTATVNHDGRELERSPTPEDFVMLEVRDEGCGIPPEKLENIFDPFYTTKPSGHGLGLAAVLGIVRNHGGDIEVDSTIGEGTSFRVLLPCPDAATLAAAEPEDAPRPRIRLPTATNPAQLHGSSSRRRVRAREDGPGYVLIVDDERMVRELAGEVLEHAGHRVLLACDGDDGLRTFEAHGHEIDLVVLDRTMPGLDGLELLAKMRKRRPDLPAIISSGYAEDDGTRGLRALGIDALLQKPWAPSDLVHLVGELGLRPDPAAAAATREASRSPRVSLP